MKEITTELDDVTARAKVIYNRIEKDWEELGKLLVRARELVPYGHWVKYLEDNFPMIAERTARKYMQAVREEMTPTQLDYGEHQVKTAESADLNPEPERLPVRRLTEHQVIAQQLEGHPYIPRDYLERTLMRDLQELEDKVNANPGSNVLPELHAICLKVASRAQQLADRIDSALQQGSNVTCFPSKL